MKTKIIFLLLAAVLLGSVSVNARSKKAPKKTESTTPIKGDVNGDGKVDVADIVAIIAIMKNGGTGEKKYYWYVGMNNGNEVNSSNYTSVASLVSESEIPSTGTFDTHDAWEYIYFVMPSNKSLTSLMDGMFEIVFEQVVSTNDVNIYKTLGKFDGILTYTIENSASN